MTNFEFLGADARKIHLIEEVLKVNSNNTLTKLEDVLNVKNIKLKKEKKKNNIYDFVGIMNKKEIGEMQKIINETCENINTNGWQ